MATEMQFGIEFPAEVRVGDYVQSTPHYEQTFKTGFYGRIYRIDKGPRGNTLQIVFRNGDKQAFDEDWCRKVSR